MTQVSMSRLIGLLSIVLSGLAAHAEPGTGAEFFNRDIRPIFEARCIQCHSCYNAPCQLKLTSVDGLDRGMVHDFDVFTPNKLREAPMSRVGIDRKTTEEWRNFSSSIHFMPVTQDPGNVQKNIDASLILKLVEQKKQNASLVIDDLANPDLYAEASRSCPDPTAKLADHLKARPNAGMPYGLPPLSDEQIKKIQDVIKKVGPFR